MKQIETIKELKKVLTEVKGINVSLLYGSFGRNEANPNSDIDVQIFINDCFQTQDLIQVLKSKFQNEIQYISEVSLRNKIVAYFKSQPKIEFAICKSLDEISKYYLGSEISNVADTILYANDIWKAKIQDQLLKIVEEYSSKKVPANIQKDIMNLVDKFVYEFENCSTMHRRGDGYQFYFFYNIALHTAVQLKYLSTGETKFNFLPKRFLANTLNEVEQKSFYDLKGTLYLPEANSQKRKLLDCFYTSIQNLVDTEKQEEIKTFLEWIYDRDFFWNFRDISTHNPKIKKGIVFRTATLSLFQNEQRFEDLLRKNKIKTIIDLRADREIEELPYHENTLSKLNYVKTPFDPWNQPQWFKENYHYGTNEEIAYRFFAIGCNDKIKKALEAIINQDDGAIAIHCFAGKDRTGIFISLLHLLVETPLETIYADYLASEVDVKPYRLEMILKIIDEKGGIIPYLIEAGLDLTQIQKLKSKLKNED